MNTLAADIINLGPNYGMVELKSSSPIYQQTLLLVDDDENVLKSLLRALRPLDCKVVTAISAAQALEVMAEIRPDMIISDVRMPVMDGIELLSIIAADYPDTDRVVLTGYADIEATITAINSGHVSHYLNKPWDTPELIALVEKTLSKIDLLDYSLDLQKTIKNQNVQLKQFNKNLEKKVSESTEELVSTNILLDENRESRTQNYRKSVELYAQLLANRKGCFFKGDHQCSRLAIDIAKMLGVEDERLEALHYATKLRYIGLLGLSDSVVNTPVERMSNQQRNDFEQYPLLSYALVSTQPDLNAAAEIILQHKERMDGNGFPNKLSKSSLLITSKILAVVNDFMALRAGLITGRRLAINDALSYLSERQESHYSSSAVSALAYLVENDFNA